MWNERKCSFGEIDCGLVALGEGNARQVKRIQGVQASLLGVGAPEALVIGVVALLVFGPKGLAEVFFSPSFLPSILCSSFCLYPFSSCLLVYLPLLAL